MKVQVDSDKLFEAYKKAENNDAREQLREIILGAEGSVQALYPPTHTAIGPIDAEAVVEELKELETNEPMSVEDAQKLLNEQSPRDHGHVIQTMEGSEYDLYVGTGGFPDAIIDEYDTPDGWHAESNGSTGIEFYRDD